MRLHVELEDGKAETVFVPAAAMREANDLDLEGIDFTIYVAWRTWHRKGWTDLESWEDFAEVAWITAAETDDPKA